MQYIDTSFYWYAPEFTTLEEAAEALPALADALDHGADE